jgi:hypothetical protein
LRPRRLDECRDQRAIHPRGGVLPVQRQRLLEPFSAREVPFDAPGL